MQHPQPVTHVRLVAEQHAQTLEEARSQTAELRRIRQAAQTTSRNTTIVLVMVGFITLCFAVAAFEYVDLRRTIAKMEAEWSPPTKGRR